MARRLATGLRKRQLWDLNPSSLDLSMQNYYTLLFLEKTAK